MIMPEQKFQIDADFWFDRTTWSTYMAFVLLTGLVLLIFLPNSQRIVESLTALPDMVIFPAFFVILYGILAITLGQAEIHWQGRLSWSGSLAHLLARQLFALALTLPYWLIFLRAHLLGLEISVGIGLYLCIYGFVLSLFGWRLALTQRSEVFQFNVKYLVFALLLLSSFFVPGIQALNPLWPLEAWLREDSFAQWFGPLLQSSLWWAIVGLLLALWIRHSLLPPGEIT